MNVRVRKRGTSLVAAVLAASASMPAEAQSDVLFQANFESAPDCLPVGSTECPGFVVETPRIPIAGGAAVGYCYYFRTPNSALLGIGRFSSMLGPVSGHLIVYTTVDSVTSLPADANTPGTLAACGGSGEGAGSTVAHQVYAAYKHVEALRMPDDDGAGKPLALEVAANAAGFIEIFLVNGSLDPIETLPVRVVANARPAATDYTKTATYVTLNYSMSIPANSTEQLASYACNVPSPAKFWHFSTQTYSHATLATLRNGGTPLVSSTDWELPSIATFSAPSFYQFGVSDKLTYECTYVNNTFSTITFGGDYAFDETCMGIGYFFPADQPKICLNATGPF